MFKKLRTAVYHVEDLTQAKEWYTKITGIEPYFDQPFYVGFDINGFELGLDPDMTNLSRSNQAIAYWAVDQIEDRVNELLEAGASLAEPVKEVGGGIKVASVCDPFGNIIGLIEETATV